MQAVCKAALSSAEAKSITGSGLPLPSRVQK